MSFGGKSSHGFAPIQHSQRTYRRLETVGFLSIAPTGLTFDWGHATHLHPMIWRLSELPTSNKGLPYSNWCVSANVCRLSLNGEESERCDQGRFALQLTDCYSQNRSYSHWTRSHLTLKYTCARSTRPRTFIWKLLLALSKMNLTGVLCLLDHVIWLWFRIPFHTEYSTNASFISPKTVSMPTDKLYSLIYEIKPIAICDKKASLLTVVTPYTGHWSWWWNAAITHLCPSLDLSGSQIGRH